jgi:predicted Zn-dependent protease
MSDSSAGLLTEPIVDTSIADRLRAALPDDVDYVDFASARLVDERSEHLMVRQNTLEPIFNEFDTGVVISIWNDGGLGCAATADLSDAGLHRAVDTARSWAAVTAGCMVTTTPPLVRFPLTASPKHSAPGLSLATSGVQTSVTCRRAAPPEPASPGHSFPVCASCSEPCW